MSDAKNPLSKFLLAKMLESNHNTISLSHEAAYQIIDELERQDRQIDAMAMGADCK